MTLSRRNGSKSKRYNRNKRNTRNARNRSRKRNFSSKRKSFKKLRGGSDSKLPSPEPTQEPTPEPNLESVSYENIESILSNLSFKELMRFRRVDRTYNTIVNSILQKPDLVRKSLMRMSNNELINLIIRIYLKNTSIDFTKILPNVLKQLLMRMSNNELINLNNTLYELPIDLQIDIRRIFNLMKKAGLISKRGIKVYDLNYTYNLLLQDDDWTDEHIFKILLQTDDRDTSLKMIREQLIRNLEDKYAGWHGVDELALKWSITPELVRQRYSRLIKLIDSILVPRGPGFMLDDPPLPDMSPH